MKWYDKQIELCERIIAAQKEVIDCQKEIIEADKTIIKCLKIIKGVSND
jgi:hypothetical protein